MNTDFEAIDAHLTAAATALNDLPDVDLTFYREFLDHNEFGLAFDELVDIGHDVEDPGMPVEFWKNLDAAARQMGMYSTALYTPRLTSADFCLRRLATATEKTKPISIREAT